MIRSTRFGPVSMILLKKICSDIEVSRFSLSTSPDSTSVQDQAVDAGQTPAFKLTSDRSRYYAGESFSVQISPVQPSSAAPNADGCPTLYMRERSPDGATRIDEVQPIASKGCPQFVPGRRPIGSESSFELDSGANSKWEGLGEHTLQVFQLAGSSNAPQLQFVSSNVLRIQLADPAAIPRKWGPKVKGIAADITVDKDTFRLGEYVPLHLAVEDFDADCTIYSWDPVWDPCSVVAIEVQDAEGRPLPTSKRFPDRSVCMGHGFGPRPIAKGKVIPVERTLAGEGWLPNHSGTFTVIVTWAPCDGSNKNAATANTPPVLRPHAVVHAMATVHIVSNETSHSR